MNDAEVMVGSVFTTVYTIRTQVLSSYSIYQIADGEAAVQIDTNSHKQRELHNTKWEHGQAPPGPLCNGMQHD